jgi:hypothetical protein
MLPCRRAPAVTPRRRRGWSAPQTRPLDNRSLAVERNHVEVVLADVDRVARGEVAGADARQGDGSLASVRPFRGKPQWAGRTIPLLLTRSLRHAVTWPIEQKGYAPRPACGLVGLAPTTYRSRRCDGAALPRRLRARRLAARLKPGATILAPRGLTPAAAHPRSAGATGCATQLRRSPATIEAPEPA